MLIRPYEAAKEIHAVLTSERIPYVIIGGIAVQKWGNPRLTKDVYATLMVRVEETEKMIALISQRFASRVKDPKDFVLRTRVLPAVASNGCEIDFSFALPGYEELMLERAVLSEPRKGVKIKICSA